VPSEAARKVFAGRAGAGAIDDTKLAAGAPANFIAGALAGLDALARLDHGTLDYAAGGWSLSGQAASVDQRQAVAAAVAAVPDAGAWRLDLATEGAAPLVAPYRWSATKAADGSVTLDGYVLSDELKRFAAVRAGTVAGDTTRV